MGEPVTPILLRVPAPLAEAMTRASVADDRSRNAWMVAALTTQAAAYLTPQQYAVCTGQAGPDDQPLPGV